MTLSAAIHDFIEYLEKDKKASLNTLKNYHRYLKEFENFCGEITVKDLNYELIQKYKTYLSQKSLKTTSQNYFLIALRSFLTYLLQNNLTTLDPKAIGLGKQEKFNFEVLSTEELEKILSLPSHEKKGLRDQAVLQVLCATGFKVSQLAALNREDIYTLPLPENIIAHLERYIEDRKDAFRPLFIRFQGKMDLNPDGEKMRLTVRSLERIVKKYTNTTPQTLRHSYAKRLLNEGKNLSEVQQELGHKHITTTQIYTKLA